jgi:hypothetical protein
VADGTPLQAAARDAEAMSERFHGLGYSNPSRHRLLVRDAATAPAILDAIQTTTTSDDRLDLLLIYWAGRMSGTRAHVLSTYDGNDDSSGGVALDVLTTAFVAAQARHRVLILDACHDEGAAAPLAQLSAAFSPDQCAVVLASGATTALQREHRRRGYLAGSLLEQLAAGNRGVPQSTDLLGAIHAAAACLTDRLHQPPFLGIYGTALLPLAVLRHDVRGRRAHAA